MAFSWQLFAELSRWMAIVADVLSPFGMELCMFGLAGLFYVFFSGGLTTFTVVLRDEHPTKEVGGGEESSAVFASGGSAGCGGRGHGRGSACGGLSAASVGRTRLRQLLRRRQQRNMLRPVAGDPVGGGRWCARPGEPAPNTADPAGEPVPTVAAVAVEAPDGVVVAAAPTAKRARAVSAGAISACGKDGRLEQAVTIFEQIKSEGLHMNSTVYNCLLDACVQCGDVSSALRYFKEMEDLDLLDVVSHNTLIRGHLRMGDIKAADTVISEMAERGLVANRITYHGLLNARAESQDAVGAFEVIDRMQSQGFAPNAVTCSILLKVLSANSRSADVMRAMAVVDKVEKQMDEVLFASVVEACVRTGRLDLLSERTRKYDARSCVLKLTAPIYGSMIKAYGQACDVTRVWELWDDMRRHEVILTAITLGCMVEALVANQRVDDAWQLVHTVWNDESTRSAVNTVIYSTLLKGFAMAKRGDMVMALYDEMRVRQITCNTITYNTILNAFARSGVMHRLPQLLEDMKSSNPPVEPDLVTYSTIMKGFCQAGAVERGFQLLREMREQGKYQPDEVMYNSLLDGCARQHLHEGAVQLLDEMREAGVAPSNYTLSILVKILGRARRLNQAFFLVETVPEAYGFRPNVQVYTCLAQACFHNRQVGRAIALHNQIVNEDKCFLDEKAYSVLTRGCLQSGSLRKAAEVVRCAYHLPGHSLAQTRGLPPGVDRRCVEDLLAKLGPRSATAHDLAAELEAGRVGSAAASRRREEPCGRGGNGGTKAAPHALEAALRRSSQTHG